jgi:hypothetical protein
MLTFNRTTESGFRLSGERVGWSDHWVDWSLKSARATAGFSREGEKSTSFLSAVAGWTAWITSGFSGCGLFVTAILIVRRRGVIICKRVTKSTGVRGQGKRVREKPAGWGSWYPTLFTRRL